MKKIIITIVTLGTLANAGTTPFKDYNLGVSTFKTKIENQVMAKCANVESNMKTWKQCKKRVIKKIIRDSKQGKKR